VGVTAWSKLPDDVRQVLEHTAREVEAWAREKGAADDDGLRAKLEEAGMQVNVADREAFVDASKPIYAAFASEVPTGQELTDAALSLADQ
jgi:TRAP-type C4-dicarboxylate transport system substrate-binding protein